MPYDPDVPALNAELTSPMFRDQFQGLKALIDAVSGVTSAVVDGVSTLNPGESASVTVSVIGTELHLSFAIPRGNDGANGMNGNDGGPGPQGPPFASAVVDGVSTLPAGDPASVSVSFDGTNVHFSFGIPQGHDGATGATGQPGEVTNADLQNAVTMVTNDSSANSNAVNEIITAMADPDAEILRVKINELIAALRR